MINDNEPSPTIRMGADPAQEAVDWLVRLTSGEASDQDRAAFAAWHAKPAHAAHYAEIERIWDMAGPALEAPPKVVPLPIVRPRRFAWANRRNLAVAASLALAVSLGFQYEHNWRHDQVAPGSAQKVAELADGSRLVLNPGAAIDVAYKDGVRHVTLARGEVFFDVKHDPAHPFIIDAGAGNVRVLGTAFSVRRDGDDGVVMVERGKVRVQAGDAMVDLVRGQSVTYRPGAEGKVTSVDPDVDLAWSRGRLIFENKPLGEVIEKLDAYYPGRLILVDRQAAQRRVNAVIDLARVDAWLDALHRSQNVAVHRVPGVVTILD
ncbi:FecR domain-containing protein [Sphingomonas sp.]|uniref:FecR family protein n=1 Tax=Sphingomonas sp. TaxID=28214 RepID=UPI0025EC50D4|nr:FecR domain-containing protein [Sphingomonas sp.]